MLNIKYLAGILICLCCLTNNLSAQQSAIISADELTYNFGTIAEADGPASHTFTIKNTGTTPLVITRVTASCGCTQPEWTEEPIAAGKTGEVKVTYNPKGRPGPFHKTISIFSNGKTGSYTLAIKGYVTPKPSQPLFTYPYSIGSLKLHTKTILYNTIRPNETLGEKIMVKNEGKTSLILHIGKHPHFLTIEARPDTLKPDETGEISILMDAQAAKRKGRISVELPLTVQSIGEKTASDNIMISANAVDDFSKLTSSQKENAPIAQLSGTLLDFGKIDDSGSFMGIAKKISGTIDITNSGKSPLVIYSVTCDDELIDISGGRREIKPGATSTYKISFRPKQIKTKLETLINIVCNDPNGPVRLVKVTAEK